MTTEKMPSGFRYELAHRYRFGEWEWRYRVEGRDGACEFWVRTSPFTSVGQREHYGGFEVHRAAPAIDDGPPDHGRCEALSERACWHDCSSLYAEEYWVPKWERDKNDHEGIFRSLVGEYRTRFGAGA